MASLRFCWPLSALSQVGDSESSKSAMKTRAPELSALIIILRSTGPVISQRRSSRSGGRRRHLPLRLAHFLRRGQEVGGFAGVDPLLARRSGFEPAAPLGVESAVEVGDEGERLRRQDVPGGGWNGPLDLDRHRTLSFASIRVLPRENANARGEG